VDKVKIAIDRLRTFQPLEGYYGAFSGGKDSQTIYHLCKEGNIKVDWHYNITGIDPPELFRFIKSNYPDVKMEQHKESMFKLMAKKGMPTRLSRFCCEKLKEKGGEGRFVITGVRWAESDKRKNNRSLIELNSYTSKRITLNNDNDESRRMIEQCTMKSKHIINPIIDWDESDVWDYLNNRGIEHCELYDKGFDRLGCIGCPLSSNQEKELLLYPKYADNYKRAIAKFLIKYKARKESKGIKPQFETVEDMWEWWLHGTVRNKPLEGQIDFDLNENE
jgi:phosphoadenosine phosphosulfate reductase